MRPIANFTLHAMLAAVLAAFAATSAAAGQFDAFLEFGSIKGETESHQAGGQRSQHIDLLSYSFGASRLSKVDGFTVKQGLNRAGNVNESRSSSDASAGKGASNEMRMEDNAGGSGRRLDPVFVKSWSTSGDASGGGFPGRGVDIAAVDGQVYPAGSVALSGRFPSCRVGAAYDRAAIGHGRERYDMQDITVADCSNKSMNLNFKKVTVRGWDPSKKEE